MIGRVQIPSVHEGEALFHISRFRGGTDEVADGVDAFQQIHLDDDDAVDPPIV